MESRFRLLILAALFPLLVLFAWMVIWLYGALNPPEETSVAPAPTPRVATLLPTYTPSPTPTPVVIVFPTDTPPPVVPTATPKPTGTGTPTLVPVPGFEPTATRAPVTAPPVRFPTNTPTPTNTPEGGQYPFKVESGPTLALGRPCVSQNIVFGYIKNRSGAGMANMRLRLMPKYGNPPELPALTRGGNEAGYFELTLGASANEWDIYMVDETDNPISPTARFVLLQVESGQCWWQLNWIQR